MAQGDRVDPRFPSREESVLPLMLERRATEEPGRTFVVFDDGNEWTFADGHSHARSCAVGLQSLGVTRDDNVLVWLPNGPDCLRVWFGANYLGATYVPINTAYRGRLLEHVLQNSAARLLVVHAALVERLAEVSLGAVEQLVVVGGTPPDVELPVPMLRAGVLDGNGAAYEPPARPVQPWDVETIVYTSGTTGPSKGVLCSYLHQWATSGAVANMVLPDDRYMLTMPLYHAGGTLGVTSSLLTGCSIVIVPGFRTEEFWDVVRRTGATTCTLLGAMATFLAKEPPRPSDRDHTLRVVYIIPLTEEAPTFSERFGVDVYTLFNMTEVSCPIMSDRNPKVVGACGTVRPGIEARLVDEFDREVPEGEVGELVLRADLPWSMSHGYHAMPDATARAWRNGWFHTGDGFRRDAGGNFFFVDRVKDAIRRRGENISSFEVEAEVLAHPDVREAAAVAVPSDYGEDEVLVAVAPVAGRTIDPVELIGFLVPRMAHFMVPRYVRVVGELPRTPTTKVEKYRLRSEGVTPDTWDREGAGVQVRRERIG